MVLGQFAGDTCGHGAGISSDYDLAWMIIKPSKVSVFGPGNDLNENWDQA